MHAANSLLALLSLASFGAALPATSGAPQTCDKVECHGTRKCAVIPGSLLGTAFPEAHCVPTQFRMARDVLGSLDGGDAATAGIEKRAFTCEHKQCKEGKKCIVIPAGVFGGLADEAVCVPKDF